MNDSHTPGNPIEVVPAGGFNLAMPDSAHFNLSGQGFYEREPEIAAALKLVLDAVQTGLVPETEQKKLWDAMPDGLRREVIAVEGRLDAVTLSTFKRQVSVIDQIMKNMFTPDGMPIEGAEEAMGMSRKDALNLWLKLNQMMTRDLPKVMTMERVQRLEHAIGQVMEETMTEEQQQLILIKLSKMD